MTTRTLLSPRPPGTPRTAPRLLATALLAPTLVVLAGCGGSAGAGGDSPVRVVASTNVYGDIAEAVGGRHVSVSSILTNPDQDPHSFEADPRTALSISRADLLIENGGGYDDYMQTLRSSQDSDAPVIDVVQLSGKKAPVGGELNEHVWYDLPTVVRLTGAIADRLAAADADHASAYRANAKAYAAKVEALEQRERTARHQVAGRAIGITEPVPLYLTAALGLVNRTPAEFSEAIEEGDDVSATVLEQTLDLYRRHRVSALVYNEQTADATTATVQHAAEAAGIAVVPVTETLPKGQDYLTWMGRTIDAVVAGVSR